MSTLIDPVAGALDPHALWAIAMVALALVLVLLAICIDTPGPRSGGKPRR